MSIHGCPAFVLVVYTKDLDLVHQKFKDRNQSVKPDEEMKYHLIWNVESPVKIKIVFHFVA